MDAKHPHSEERTLRLKQDKTKLVNTALREDAVVTAVYDLLSSSSRIETDTKHNPSKKIKRWLKIAISPVIPVRQAYLLYLLGEIPSNLAQLIRKEGFSRACRVVQDEPHTLLGVTVCVYLTCM